MQSKTIQTKNFFAYNIFSIFSTNEYYFFSIDTMFIIHIENRSFIQDKNYEKLNMEDMIADTCGCA